ncbi:histidinol-phosphate transaminase [Carboxydocella sp. ULO1]|uniref:pyridoxal phosphate-dependent aminotransferase n=1 Tax=Carboxydocella sp. ULO1 TaxID=1926599 RepID=UPI0009AD23A3|nr:histidinol-phosphate transaminase [Carboxydocella sp. ULO1]GAW28625.1 histidinol-phosphate aminotransferase [Carboxydocella sp. ULO1]
MKIGSVKLDKNENRFGFSPKLLNLSFPVILNRYPSNETIDLIESLSSFYSVRTENILVTNGSSEALELLFRFIKSYRYVVVPKPCFSGYRILSQLHGIVFKQPVLDLVDRDDENLTEMIKGSNVFLLSNPVNPSGRLFSRNKLRKLLECFKDVLFIIDEAYGEYSETTVTDFIQNYSNLIVIKTFSKAYGLAGLRVGYIIGCSELINRLRSFKIPYSVNSMALIAANIALEDQEHLKKVIAWTKEMRDYLARELISRQFVVIPSYANFLLVKPPVNSIALWNFLCEKEIFVRRFNGELEGWLRITVGPQNEMDTLLAAIDIYLKNKRSG